VRRAPAGINGMLAAPPLVVQLLAGNPATAVALLPLLNTVDATALRRLHPAVAVAVESMPWCDRKIRVDDMVRWRAAFPAATAARVVRRLGPAVTATTLAGLTYLDVSGQSKKVTDSFIRLLPPTLRELDMHDCGRLSDAVSFAHLPALETLNCSSTDLGNSAIASLSPSLQVLQADYCGVKSGVNFRHLLALRALNCCRLKSDRVNLCGSHMPPSLEELDLGGFILMPHGAPLVHLARLRTLMLTDCKLPSTALSSLPPSIKRLTLTTCSGLATSSFPHPPLAKLHFLYCPGSDVGDAALASLPSSLTFVEVTGAAAQLTPAATFPPHMPALNYVNMSYTAIGDAAIASLPRNLQTLYLQNCTSVTPAARLDHLVKMTTLHSSGTNLALATLAVCRARGCDAAADGMLRGHGRSKVLSLAALPDGRLASGDARGTVQVWAASDDGTYKAIGDGLVGHGGKVRALVALPDGRHLAAGVCTGSQRHTRGGVVVWDLGTVSPPRTTSIAFDAGVTALAQLAGNNLAVGCDDGRIHVVDATAGAVAGAILVGHTTSVTALAVLPDGGTLASGSADRTVRLWDVGARTCVATLAGHTDAVAALAVLDDGRLASASHDNSVRLWDAASRTCVRVLRPTYPTTLLAALSDGTLAGATTYSFIIDVQGVAGWRAFSVLDGHTSSVTALVALPGNRLASASEDGTVRLWQLPTRPRRGRELGAKLPRK